MKVFQPSAPPDRVHRWDAIVTQQRRWPTTVLGGATGLSLYGCDGFDDITPTAADLRTTSKGSRAPYRSARPFASTRAKVTGIRVLAPVALLAECAAAVDWDRVEAALETFLRRRQISEVEVLEGIRNGRRAWRPLRQLMDRRGWGIPPTESYLETLAVQRVFRPAGLPHDRQVVVSLGGAYLKRFDFRLPSGLLVNCHGMRFHTSAAAVQQDATYGLRLRLAGLEVETITWDDVTRRPQKTGRDLATRDAQVAAAAHERQPS